MNGFLTASSLREGTSGGSGVGLRVCHGDDVPRLRGHLVLISALELHGLMGDEALLAELPCPGCEAWPVMTCRGLRGITDGEWSAYRRLCELGARMARSGCATGLGRMGRRARRRLIESEVGRE